MNASVSHQDTPSLSNLELSVARTSEQEGLFSSAKSFLKDLTKPLAVASVLSVGALVGTEQAQAATLAAFPYTKAQFDGGFDYGATQNSPSLIVAGRTLTVTNELKSHTGNFQIDLISTLYNQIGTINANNVTTATIYGSDTPAGFLAQDYTPIFTIDLRNGFVNSIGGEIQTISTPNGSQFAQASDLGTSSFGDTYYGFSGATTNAQSLLFSNWLNSFNAGHTAAIGISFDLNSNDGFLSIGGANSYLGGNNYLIADGNIQSNSLGFNINPMNIPEPATPILLLSAGIGLSLIRRRKS